MSAGRNPYFDFLRCIAIVMVVGIHAYPEYVSGAEIGSLSRLLRLSLNCAVPLFLAISGYFMARKQVGTAGEHLAFLRRQVPKVYVPAVVFSVFWFLYDYQWRRVIDLVSVINVFTCGHSVYYFIALIIQYYLLLPWLQRCAGKGWLALFAAVSALSIVTLTFVRTLEGVNLSMLASGGCSRCGSSSSASAFIMERQGGITALSFLCR